MEIQLTTLILVLFFLFFTFQLVRFTDRLNDLSSKIPDISTINDNVDSVRNQNNEYRDTIMERLNQINNNRSEESEYNRSFINDKINTIEYEILNNTNRNNLNYAEINSILANLTSRPYVSAEDLNTNLNLIINHINDVQDETRVLNLEGQRILGDSIISTAEINQAGQEMLGDSIISTSEINQAGQGMFGNAIVSQGSENNRPEDIEGGINYCPLVNNQRLDNNRICRSNNFYNSKIISDSRQCIKGYKYIYDYTNNRYDCVKCDAVENSLNYDCRPVNNDYTVPNIEYVSYPITCMDGYTVSGNDCISDGSDISYPECGDGYYQINNGKCINCPLLDGVERKNCYSFNGEEGDVFFDDQECSDGYEFLDTDNIYFKRCMKLIDDSDFYDGKITKGTLDQIINNGLIYLDKTTSNNCNLGTFYANVEANDQTDEKIYKLCYISLGDDNLKNKVRDLDLDNMHRNVFVNKLINEETDFCKVIPYSLMYGVNNTFCLENKNTSSFINTNHSKVCLPGFYPNNTDNLGLGQKLTYDYEKAECKKCERKNNAFTVECNNGYDSVAVECFNGYELIGGECVCQGTCVNYDEVSCVTGKFRDRDGTCKDCINHLTPGDNSDNYSSVDECIPVYYDQNTYVYPTSFVCNDDSQHIRLDHEMCVKREKPTFFGTEPPVDESSIYLSSGEGSLDEEGAVCGTQDGVDVLELRNSNGIFLVNTLIGDKITISENNIDYEPVKVCVYNKIHSPCEETDRTSKPSWCLRRTLNPGPEEYFNMNSFNR